MTIRSSLTDWNPLLLAMNDSGSPWKAPISIRCGHDAWNTGGHSDHRCDDARYEWGRTGQNDRGRISEHQDFGSFDERSGDLVNKMIDESDISGYVLKNIGKQELINALDKIASGGVTLRMRSWMKWSGLPKKTELAEARLTNREIEIIRLIEKEYNNKMIAETLFWAKGRSRHTARISCAKRRPPVYSDWSNMPMPTAWSAHKRLPVGNPLLFIFARQTYFLRSWPQVNLEPAYKIWSK